MTVQYTRPDWMTKHIVNPLVAFVTSIGFSLRGSRILAVRGRKSGQIRTTPVNLLEIGGARYLVPPGGETEWVRNLRAAGDADRARGNSAALYPDDGVARIGTFAGQVTTPPRITSVIPRLCTGRSSSCTRTRATTCCRRRHGCGMGEGCRRDHEPTANRRTCSSRYNSASVIASRISTAPGRSWEIRRSSTAAERSRRESHVRTSHAASSR